MERRPEGLFGQEVVTGSRRDSCAERVRHSRIDIGQYGRESGREALGFVACGGGGLHSGGLPLRVHARSATLRCRAGERGLGSLYEVGRDGRCVVRRPQDGLPVSSACLPSVGFVVHWLAAGVSACGSEQLPTRLGPCAARWAGPWMDPEMPRHQSRAATCRAPCGPVRSTQ